MNWRKLLSIEDVQGLIQDSNQQPQVIFKHSTRCGISMLALARLKSRLPNVEYHLLDLIAYRDVSNYIADTFSIPHSSPQILLIIDGKCIFDTSHMDISSKVIERELSKFV